MVHCEQVWWCTEQLGKEKYDSQDVVAEFNQKYDCRYRESRDWSLQLLQYS